MLLPRGESDTLADSSANLVHLFLCGIDQIFYVGSLNVEKCEHLSELFDIGVDLFQIWLALLDMSDAAHHVVYPFLTFLGHPLFPGLVVDTTSEENEVLSSGNEMTVMLILFP